MALEAYIERRWSDRDLKLIATANEIIEEYAAQGFSLTLRQLYYQFVARDILPNHVKMYKLLGNVINDARLNGKVDWLSIVDRTRSLRGKTFWDSPGEIVKAAADSFNVDRWAGQRERPEVWIEKDALIGVFEGICRNWDISYFSCRGYTSQSEMWVAAKRMLRRFDGGGQKTIIYHFGDHDPSGIDMTRDIEDRITLFCGDLASEVFEIRRVALSIAQVKKYKCPPNPAKTTDARSEGYIKRFGPSSWELDALDPKVLARLVEDAADECIDDSDEWSQKESLQTAGRLKILEAGKKLK